MTELRSYLYNQVADGLSDCARRHGYGLLPFLGLLAVAPLVPAFLLVVPRFALVRPALLLLRVLAFAMVVLVFAGGVTTVTLALVTVILAFAGRLVLPFPLFAFSV